MSVTNFKRFVEVGRIVLLGGDGPDSGKIAAIVEIVDQNRVIVDGPTTDVSRKSHPLKHLTLTGLKITDLPRACRSGVLKKFLEKEAIVEKWNKSAWAQKRLATQARRNMTDFERFKVLVARKQRRDIVRKSLAKA